MIQVSGRDAASISIIQLHPGYVADDADTVQTLLNSGGGGSTPTAPQRNYVWSSLKPSLTFWSSFSA